MKRSTGRFQFMAMMLHGPASYWGKRVRIVNLVWTLTIWADKHGQDLIEYALMAGFVAVAAGAIMPGVTTSISKSFGKIASTMTAAAATS
jgi:Flp pilus assembly pilin Flp